MLIDKPMRLRLLPPNRDLDGWTPYAWLVYLVFFALTPFFLPSTDLVRWLSVAGALIAVPLYFAGYWLKGLHTLWVIAAFLALGIAFAQVNPAASAMVVYGACYCGEIGEPRVAFPFLGGVLAVVGLMAWLLHLRPEFLISAEFFAALIGAITIHHAQRGRLSAKLLRAQEEVEHFAKLAERERIARDLHDLLGHTLSVIILKSELASKLAAKQPERALEEIRDVEHISRQALAQVRAAVRGYRSDDLESEVRRAAETLKVAGVALETAVEAAPLSATQESIFALALREAVTNVLRHAHATDCRLSLRRNGQWCEMEIADNGRGGAIQPGTGLTGMRERVEALGGVLEHDGSNGMRVRIRVPA
jgi:two-component system sensor histidine kinase DesK